MCFLHSVFNVFQWEALAFRAENYWAKVNQPTSPTVPSLARQWTQSSPKILESFLGGSFLLPVSLQPIRSWTRRMREGPDRTFVGGWGGREGGVGGVVEVGADVWGSGEPSQLEELAASACITGQWTRIKPGGQEQFDLIGQCCLVKSLIKSN